MDPVTLALNLLGQGADPRLARSNVAVSGGARISTPIAHQEDPHAAVVVR